MPRIIALVGLMILLATQAVPQTVHAQEPAILTITGEIDRTNRPPFDAFRDALFGALDEPFQKAYAFSRADLLALPQVELTVSYPTWPAPVIVTGPLLADVLATVGATGDTVLAQAVDGYSPSLKLSELGDAPVVRCRELLAIQLRLRQFDRGPHLLWSSASHMVSGCYRAVQCEDLIDILFDIRVKCLQSLER